MFFAPIIECSSQTGSRDDRNRELVVLVHGLSAKRLIMWPVARRLRGAGFQVCNWGYRSTTRSIDWHATRLAAVFREADQRDDIDRVHIVAHSMGCIVSRAAIEKPRPKKLARMVMLAPPNHGSHAARVLAPVVDWFCPTMKEISDRPDSYVNSLPLLNGIEFGVIAAGRDKVIRQSSTHLDGESDFTVVTSMHGILPLRIQTQRHVLQFLKSGRFLAEETRGKQVR